MLCTGIIFGWSGPAIPQLLAPDAKIPITSDQVAYLTGALQIGAIPGALLGSILGDYLGRKKSIIAIAIPYLLSQLLLGFGTNIYHLFAARIIGGLAVGANYSLVPMYLSEISTASIRGILGSSVGMSLNIGVLIQYLIGLYNPYSLTGLICSIFPVIFFLTMFGLPESPYYLLLIDDQEGAREALKQLRGTSNVNPELRRLVDALRIQKAEKSGGCLELFSNQNNRKTLLLITGVFIAQQGCGIAAIFAYSQIIFDSLDIGISSNAMGISLALMNFVISIVSAVCSDYVGRRKLMIVSCLGSALTLSVVTVFFYFQDNNYEGINQLGLIPLIGLLTFKFTWNLGLGTLPYILSGELLATTVKSAGSSYISVLGSCIAFSVLKFYQVTSDAYGNAVPYSCFTIILFLSALFSYLALPETRARTLEQIQDSLRKDNEMTKMGKK